MISPPIKIKERYSYGWSDPRVFNTPQPVFKRYGYEYKIIEENKMESKFEAQDYSVEIKVKDRKPLLDFEKEYTHMIAASMNKIVESSLAKIFADTYNRFAKRYTKEDDRGKKMKEDGHEYTTVAKDLPIDVCKNMWLVKYGNEPIESSMLLHQDALTWEIGNKLFWADVLFHDIEKDTYSCK
jgi:hypothetical protein